MRLDSHLPGDSGRWYFAALVSILLTFLTAYNIQDREERAQDDLYFEELDARIETRWALTYGQGSLRYDEPK